MKNLGFKVMTLIRSRMLSEQHEIPHAGFLAGQAVASAVYLFERKTRSFMAVM